MIERYTLKFTPALSQKELAKQFESGAGLTPEHAARIHQFKVKVEVVCDFEDLKKVDEFLKQLSKA